MKRFGPPNGKATLPRYLFKYMPQFVISSIAGILYNTVIVLGPILMGRLIDAAAGSSGEQVLLSAIFFVGVTAVFQVARFVKRWFMRDQFNRIACDLRQTFLERMLGRSLPDLEKETVGDLMSRTVGDITLVVDTVMTTLNEGWDTWLLMISYFTALMFLDWRISLLASIMVPVTILLAQGMRHFLFAFSMDARKAASAANGGLQRYLDAVAVLRLFGRESDEAGEIKNSYARQSQFQIKEMLLQQALLPIYALLAGLGVVVVIALGGRQVLDGQWTIGSFNAYLVMYIAFSGRTRVAARVFNRWHAARAAWKRIREKMENPPAEWAVKQTEQADKPKERSDKPKERSDKLVERSDKPTERPDCNELRVSSLSSGPGDSPFLHDVTFTVRKGQILGVTGAVGSGKTLLAQALTGLYPYGGSITLDGRELSTLADAERKDLLSYAGHEQFLFSMSIRDNIRLTALDDFRESGESALLRALAATALEQDLSRFDQGLDTQVGEKGLLVSGGQRQRIAMARALYADTPILLLDDPFSAVDIATEQDIVSQLRKEHNQRIVLLFSHRLTAFRHVDEVLFLEKGSVLQSGTHEALLSQEGPYGDIYRAQIFLEEDIHEATTP